MRLSATPILQRRQRWTMIIPIDDDSYKPTRTTYSIPKRNIQAHSTGSKNAHIFHPIVRPVDADITAWCLRVGVTYPCAPISAEPPRGSAMAGVGRGSDSDSLLMARTGSTLKMVRCDIQHDDLDNTLQHRSSNGPPKLASGPNPFWHRDPLTRSIWPTLNEDGRRTEVSNVTLAPMDQRTRR